MTDPQVRQLAEQWLKRFYVVPISMNSLNRPAYEVVDRELKRKVAEFPDKESAQRDAYIRAIEQVASHTRREALREAIKVVSEHCHCEENGQNSCVCHALDSLRLLAEDRKSIEN